MWATGPREVGEASEKTLSENAFKLALGKGAHMVRHNDTPKSARDIIREITKNHPATLPIDKHKDTVDTTGEAINREPDEQTGRHQGELERAEEDVKRALRERDEMRKEMDGMRREKDEMRKQLEEGGRRPHEWMDDIKKQLEVQRVRMEEMEREAKKERERTEAEYKKQLADLTLRLQDATSASAADRARLQQVEAEHNKQLADINNRLRDMANTSTADQPRLEQVVKEGEVAKADYEQRLVDLERRLQGTVGAADPAEWERHQAESEKRYEAVTKMLEERTNQLWGQIEWIKKDSELKTRMKEQEVKESGLAEAALTELDCRLREAIDASASDRAILAQLLEERDWVDTERKQQLADLTCHLQNEVAHRVALEQEMKELQGRVVAAVTVPPLVPPRPTPCVQIFLYSTAHDS